MAPPPCKSRGTNSESDPVVLNPDIELSIKEEMQREGGETEAVLTKEERMYQEAEVEFELALVEVDNAGDALDQWEEENQGFHLGNPDYLQRKTFLKEAQEGLKIATNALELAERRWKEARASVENSKGNESKKRKHPIHVQVAYEEPVPNDFCMVPMDTITAYQKLLRPFHRPSNDFCRPLYFLYGPRQFGKTTLTLRLAEEIQLDSSIEVIYLCFDPSLHSSEKKLWRAIGARIGVEISSGDDLINVLNNRRKRLCLLLDEMDAMLDVPGLIDDFISVLCGWQSFKSFFHGFLGVGSYNLVTLHMKLKGGVHVSPFNLGTYVKIEPFTIQQMDDFFDQVDASYPFTRSTRLAIMDYSSGAPGVFGSLIRFTIDGNKWECEAAEWSTWFKIQTFRDYLHQYNTTYGHIQSDLLRLGEGDWKALNYVLMNQEATSSGILEFETLLQMGVLIQATDGICFSSEIMRRICMEAQPAREIDQMPSDDSPLELLSVALRSMRPKIIGHALVSNRQCPSENVFHVELYATIREILQKHDSKIKVLAEARAHDGERLDIAISNGSSYGFEIKSNKLTRGDIEAAVEQADGYKRLLQIEKMFVVNFVPRIHVIDHVFQMDNFPDIKVIHVCYPDTYDEYQLKFLGDNGVMQSRIIKSATR